ncbi:MULTISPECIES: glycosyltransferase 87 family protein [Micrococcaceae]|uniref:glycosyltransferase 87 family protein n=1 Tax=Micrococcaceae TaxID=1268 RepID=UPI0012F82FB9|nr:MULTISPECIES: glycosyltransferase 87 family protein [Micrococcaceae]
MAENTEVPGPGANRPAAGRVGFARPALIAAAVVAVVCIALLVIIFFLDTFNATVYSVGGNNISDDTQEARDIRGLYAGARAVGIILLVVSLLTAAAAGFLLYRRRNQGNPEADAGEDVGFDGLTG